MASNAKASKQLKPGLLPKWLFPLRYSDKSRFTSSCPDVVLVASISAKTKKQQTSKEGG
jgi:hypothetical protein